MFGYYLERGYGVEDSLRRATLPIPRHLIEWDCIPTWSPFEDSPAKPAWMEEMGL